MCLIKCKKKKRDEPRNSCLTVIIYSKSVVMNYTEMEAKVHDATNNEAWGASSTAMQELAQATFN